MLFQMLGILKVSDQWKWQEVVCAARRDALTAHLTCILQVNEGRSACSKPRVRAACTASIAVVEQSVARWWNSYTGSCSRWVLPRGPCVPLSSMEDSTRRGAQGSPGFC